MRLIDAELFRDKLFSHYELLKVDDYEVWPVVDVDEVLDNIEEVKAIPIKQLREWQRQYGNKCTYGTIMKCVEDWEKENETN